MNLRDNYWRYVLIRFAGLLIPFSILAMLTHRWFEGAWPRPTVWHVVGATIIAFLLPTVWWWGQTRDRQR
jgi:hypothetical protein